MERMQRLGNTNTATLYRLLSHPCEFMYLTLVLKSFFLLTFESSIKEQGCYFFLSPSVSQVQSLEGSVEHESGVLRQ